MYRNTFDVAKVTNELIEWIKDWYEKNGKGCNAVIGISGGKDSTICAALCVEALGKDRVIGVLMPNGIQADIGDSIRVCKYLDIKYVTLNIANAVEAELSELVKMENDFGVQISEQTKINLPPRIRMATLYSVSQSMNGRVINTCNLSENVCSFSTLYGDHAGDVSPLDKLTVTEIKQVGHHLALPFDLVEKTPFDGLCGKSDEETFGFSYGTLDEFIRTGKGENKGIEKEILNRYQRGKFKTEVVQIPHYEPNLPNWIKRTYENDGCV